MCVDTNSTLFSSCANTVALKHDNDSFLCAGKRFIDGKEEPCMEEFDSSDSMWRHYRSVHLGRFYYYCPALGCTGGKDNSKYGADSKDMVKKHMNVFHGLQSNMKCPRCPYVAGSKYKLRQHMDICKVDKKIKMHHCDECMKSFRAQERLAKHKKQDHPEQKGDKSAWYNCGACEKVFKTISGRRKHRGTAHKGIQFD